MKYRSAKLAAAAVLVAMLGIMVTGCSSPAMRKARAQREASLARSVRTVSQLDRHRSENLARTGRTIAERYRRDQVNTARNAAAISRLLQEEIDEWAHKEPAYRRAIGRELAGDADSIERTVPNFIY